MKNRKECDINFQYIFIKYLPVVIKYFLGVENPDSTRRTRKQTAIANLEGIFTFLINTQNTETF